MADANEGVIANKNLYNDKELFDDGGLNWYDYGFRNYDPQIGRFTQLDPLTDKFPELTPYQYASDEPIGNVDMDGLENLDALSAIPTGALALPQTLAPVVVVGLSNAVKSSGHFFSLVSNFLSKSSSYFIDGAKGFIHNMNERAKVNIAKDIAWIKKTAHQLEANRKANWASGNTIIQQLPKDFMENPLEFIEGGAELDVLKGIGLDIKIEGKAAEIGSQYTRSSLKFGQEMHKAYKVGADGVKEFRLPSGKRIDFLDIKNSTIYELKPFNRRAMRAGQEQLDMYEKELQTMPEFKGVEWKKVLDTY